MQEDSEVVKLSWELSRFAEQGAEGTRLIVMTRLAARSPEGHTRAPLNVSLVLDRSGSMNGEKIEQCKYAARYAASQLSASDHGSVVIFNGEVQVLTPHAPVRHKDVMMQSILGVVAGGSTNLSGGWLQAASMVEKVVAPGQINRIVLLTDGRATHGITDPQRLQGVAQDLQGRGIKTTTVGFGADFDEDLLRGLADAGGGNFHFIESPEEASTVFAREFEELLTTVAQNVRLRILPAADVSKVVLLQDLPTQVVAGGLEVNLGDLAAGDERNILVELLIPPGAAQQGISVLQLSYQQVVDPIVFRELSAFVESPTGSLDAVPVNPVVWREVLLSRVTSQLKEAREEADSGKLDRALERLQETRKSLDTSEFSADPTFVEQSYELERLEGMMKDRDNYQKLGRKTMSGFEASSAKEKRYTKGGVLDPGIRKALFGAKCVVFVSARDLAVEAGLPDATQMEFEGQPFRNLASQPQTSEQAARQWRWIEWRQRAVESCVADVHRLLVAFQYRWPSTAIVTTATDGLHARAGSMEVVELFGSLWRGRCTECARIYDLVGLAGREGVPLGSCGHLLRPDIVWPGERLVEAATRRAEVLLAHADALVVLGTAGEQASLSQMLTNAARPHLLLIAITAKERPKWADAHLCEEVEEGLRVLGRETSTSM